VHAAHVARAMVQAALRGGRGVEVWEGEP
jgi:hypothetical protein